MDFLRIRKNSGLDVAWEGRLLTRRGFVQLLPVKC